jgi:hypothetical protein
MREEGLTPFDVHVHPRSDGGLDLHASAGYAGMWGQASGSATAGALALVEQSRRALDEDDVPDDIPLTERPYFDLEWCRQKGGNVFSVLFPGAVEQLYRRCLGEARRGGLMLAIQIRYSDAAGPRLHELPWEMIFDRAEQQFLALWPETCVSRYLQMPRAEQPTRLGLRTLLLTMEQSSRRQLDLYDEGARICAVTRKTIRPTSSFVTSGREVRHHLRSAAEGGRPYLGWHHVGHGTTNAETGEFSLAFGGAGDDTTLADLVAVVAASGVRCAVLNICDSGRSNGLATALASANVPIVVGHRTRVLDSAAVSFAATLWRELAAGRPAELAIRTARMAILSAGWGSHWVQPILFVRTDNTYLVEERL